MYRPHRDVEVGIEFYTIQEPNYKSYTNLHVMM